MLISMDNLSPLITEILANNGTVKLTITGNSMRPLWHSRKDEVVLQRCEPDNLKKYDIPLYQREDGKYIIHRIIKVKRDTFDIVGDAQTEIERDVPKSSIIAVVSEFTHKGKLVKCSNTLYKIYSFLWCLVRPMRRFIFKAYGFLIKIKKRKKK